jgi:adenosylcobinamide-GDP ribazoletransferase
MIKSFILMLQFLTRFPINIQVDANRENISKGTLFFPFIGMLIGLLSGTVTYFLSFVNLDIAALAGVFTIIAVTGGLHVDGLSDTADGFFSSRSRERILEIMKDSRVGTFGVIAIVFDILFKYALLKNFHPKMALIALILSCGNGRTATAMLLTIGKSARENGLGKMFTNRDSRNYLVIGSIIYIAAGLLIAKYTFIVSLLVAIAFALVFMRYSYKVIDGLTGDVYGATCEMCEILSLFAFLVVGKWM